MASSSESHGDARSASILETSEPRACDITSIPVPLSRTRAVARSTTKWRALSAGRDSERCIKMNSLVRGSGPLIASAEITPSAPLQPGRLLAASSAKQRHSPPESTRSSGRVDQFVG